MLHVAFNELLINMADYAFSELVKFHQVKQVFPIIPGFKLSLIYRFDNSKRQCVFNNVTHELERALALNIRLNKSNLGCHLFNILRNQRG